MMVVQHKSTDITVVKQGSCTCRCVLKQESVLKLMRGHAKAEAGTLAGWGAASLAVVGEGGVAGGAGCGRFRERGLAVTANSSSTRGEAGGVKQPNRRPNSFGLGDWLPNCDPGLRGMVTNGGKGAVCAFTPAMHGRVDKNAGELVVMREKQGQQVTVTCCSTHQRRGGHIWTSVSVN